MPQRDLLLIERFGLIFFLLSVSLLVFVFHLFFVPEDLIFHANLLQVPCHQLHWVLRGLKHTFDWPHLPILQLVVLYRVPPGALFPSLPYELVSVLFSTVQAPSESLLLRLFAYFYV